MSDTEKLVWLEGERELPTVGMVNKDVEFDCPKRWAQSFVDQGKAKRPTKKTTKPKAQEE